MLESDQKVEAEEHAQGSIGKVGRLSEARGAHRCLGRELAMDELRGYLLCLVRWFVLEILDLKTDKTPRAPWSDLDLKLGDLAYQELQLGASPRGNVPMRARRTERAW